MASASAPCHRLLPPPLLSAGDLSPSANTPPSDLALRLPPETPMSSGGSAFPSPALKEEEQPRSLPPTASPPPPAPAEVESSLRRPPRFPRACNSRPAHKYAPQPPPPPERRTSARREKEDAQQCSRFVTPLAQAPPSPSQLPRWELRSMWELASVLNFLHVFRPLLNIGEEFSAEELETALITPNSTLDDVHMPLLKAIPPVTRMALGRATWVTVLCRKLRDWWHWVAEGEIPIVASHGMEIEMYRNLEPGTRVRILKAICDIRVEQEDVRNFIDDCLKRGIQLPLFRKERIGGDSQGISYWYEDDPIIGHRLYREIRHVEIKKAKAKGSSVNPLVSYQWETVATNLDEFEDVAEKLFSSKNRTEASLGKKLKIDFLPDIEKIHKKKERLLKKQHREALLLDSYLTADGLSSGRSLRDRKPVTYTFDDYDRSINEAIKVTKKRQDSPENLARRTKPDLSTNGKWHDPSQMDMVSDDEHCPTSNDYEEADVDNETEALDRSNRRRKRPQRYSEKDYVAVISDVDAYFDSDDDIVGEAVYDEEYLRSRKQRKMVSSGSDGDEEYHWEEENAEDDEEEEEYSLSTSEDAEERQQYKKLPNRSKHEKKLRSVDELQTGLRRSRRSTRQRINYRQYDLSETDSDSAKPGKANALDAHSDAYDELEASTASEDSLDEQVDEDITDTKTTQEFTEAAEKEQQLPEKADGHGQETRVVEKRRFLDLNELAPGTGFEDGLNAKDESMDNF